MFLSKKLTTKLTNKIILSILAISGLSITGCQVIGKNSVASAKGKPSIVVSHNVLCDFVETIAQETINLTCLIEKGQDPHTYRPTPSHRKEIEKAQAVFYSGFGLEPQIAQMLDSIANKKPVIAINEQAVSSPILTADAHQHHDESGHQSESEHDHHEHHNESEHHSESEHQQKEQADTVPDPHVWHDVDNAIAIVEQIQSSLLQLNPAQAETYLANSGALTNSLIQLHPWIQDQVATIPEGQKILVTTHNSLNYFVQGYEFDDYQTLQGLNAEDSASARDFKNLVKAIKNTQVPTIFAESTADDRVISNVAREAKIKLSDRKLWVDGLGAEGSSTDSYIKMMTHNTCAISEGLGGSCSPFAEAK